ncbi:MAG: hypothetical protein NW208_12570 [Bryobacter sp.]|nr:hypothetical protein [Bryobacter sp.]
MNVRFTEEQIRALRLVSASTGQSTSELVRQSVDRMFASKPSGEADSRWQEARSLSGAFACEPTDVAINHDKYLAEYFA